MTQQRSRPSLGEGEGRAMTQQRFEAWPPIHLKGGTHGGDLARLLNAGQNGVIRNAVLEVDPHKNRRSATVLN